MGNRALQTFGSYKVAGSVILAMKSGTLLNSSTISTKKEWSTRKTSGGEGSGPTVLILIPITVEKGLRYLHLISAETLKSEPNFCQHKSKYCMKVDFPPLCPVEQNPTIDLGEGEGREGERERERA
jgi:hypothetical protein